MAAFVKSTTAALVATQDGRGFRKRVPCLHEATLAPTLVNARDIDVALSISAGWSDGDTYEAAERMGFDFPSFESFFDSLLIGDFESIRLPDVVKSFLHLRIPKLSFILEDLLPQLADRLPARDFQHIQMLGIVSHHMCTMPAAGRRISYCVRAAHALRRTAVAG